MKKEYIVGLIICSPGHEIFEQIHPFFLEKYVHVNSDHLLNRFSMKQEVDLLINIDICNADEVIGIICTNRSYRRNILLYGKKTSFRPKMIQSATYVMSFDLISFFYPHI